MPAASPCGWIPHPGSQQLPRCSGYQGSAGMGSVQMSSLFLGKPLHRKESIPRIRDLSPSAGRPSAVRRLLRWMGLMLAAFSTRTWIT
eukprot:967008-Prorocentrum_lima.AAC.1